MKKKDIIGERFGRYKVVSFAQKRGNYPFYNCLCDCGNTKEVNYYNLVNKQTNSCGCLRTEKLLERKVSHGLSRTRFYTIYAMMRQRCFNKNHSHYNNYGGRGIRCYWDTMEEFKKDMYDSYLAHVDVFGEKETSIERIDNDRGYYKENCRWATMIEQSYNKRNTKTIIIDGEITPLRLFAKTFAEETGINVATIMDRAVKGKKLDDPLHRGSKSKKDLLGFSSWRLFSDHVGISRQRIFQLMAKGLSTNDIIKRYEKNTTN